MLIDLHAHSSGISRCCQIPAEEVLKTAKEYGIDGIVLTNHYQKSYLQNDDADAFAKAYVEEFHYTEKIAEELGLKVFFGVEVTSELYKNVHMLVYGVSEKFVLENPRVFELDQEELYKLVKIYGGVLVQAHPFRNGCTVLDTAYLDGVEINCHPLYGNSYQKDLMEIAAENKLLLTCGGDYHADTYRAHCGMYLPDNICNNTELRDFLLETKEVKLCIHEPDEETSVDVSVNLTR